MITDSDTNLILLSGIIYSDPRFSAIKKELQEITSSSGIINIFLPHTKDIWARDYMPIQVNSNKYIEYRYDPDYLQGIQADRRGLKSYPDLICSELKLNTVKTDIILDGGNVVKSLDAVILTDKIFAENASTYTRDELIKELKRLFEVNKIIIIPWDKNEEYGHADGMVRFIDNNTVLVQGYFDQYPLEFQKEFFGALDRYNYHIKKLSFESDPISTNSWVYLNFLQTKDVIIIPGLGIKDDYFALDQISGYFPEYANTNRIFQVNIRDIAKMGGGLNCLSWTIKS
jgi:agmatine/peptidylarginine deiminase